MFYIVIENYSIRLRTFLSLNHKKNQGLTKIKGVLIDENKCKTIYLIGPIKHLYQTSMCKNQRAPNPRKGIGASFTVY